MVEALDRVSPEILSALQKASQEIRAFHKKQIPRGYRLKRKKRELGVRYVPHERVALYVPGGKALYPSTVLMGAIPAKLAGVDDLTILTPANHEGRVDDIVLAAASLAKVDGLYAAGGAQAVAAASFGTETLQPVSLIVGPGNYYVTRAKWLVHQEERIAIDSPAGPSEVLIVAENVVPPEWVAADLLSQAEHGEDSVAILVTPDADFARQVVQALEARLAEDTERNSIKKEAIKRFGKVLVAKDLEEAVDFANLYAAEHLQIMTRHDDYVLNKIGNAGSVFVGPYAPVAVGDYASGTNHILPTSGLAGPFSGLSVDSFYKRFTYQKLTPKGLEDLSSVVETLAQIEGLSEEHGRSVQIRLDSLKE
jgi:histidinol dehydrogenase